jgi:hypothetical protein
MADFALMLALAQADAIDYSMCPHLVTFLETYVNEENYHAQDNFQIFMAIMASLHTNATAKITPWATQYMVSNHLASLPLLKVIILMNCTLIPM